VEHPEQPPLLPLAIIRELLWAKNTETARAVLSLWHILHKTGESASLIERRISNRFPQSLHIYS